MSEYFRVLEQIRRDHFLSEDPEVPALSRAVGPAPESIPAPAPLPRTAEVSHADAQPWSRSRPAAFAALLERLCALTSGAAQRAFVFASPSAGEGARAVVDGLGAEAERLGLAAVIATLTTSGNRSMLRRCAPDFRPLRDAGDPLPLDFRGTQWEDDLAAWLRRTAPHPDLVLIEAAPLGASVDATRLARACSGLVLIVESEATSRHALQLAREQARLSRCRTLGVVMYGTRDRVPQWLRGMLGETGRPPRPTDT